MLPDAVAPRLKIYATSTLMGLQPICKSREGTVISKGWPENVILTINFPDTSPGGVKGIQTTRRQRQKKWPTDIEISDLR